MNDPRRQESHDDGIGRIVRRVLASGPTPEERLEELLAERRRELDETAAKFDASIADLERREELLRDSRASVERMLRIGRSDLEARENELTEFLRELTEREARLAEAEAELARRRQEVGAVELKRASVERRERDLEAREAELLARKAELDEREAAPDEREAELDERKAEPGQPDARLAAEAHVGERAETAAGDAELAFVPGAVYRLVEHSVASVPPGGTVEIDGERFVVARFGRSPLPGDERRCAYLVRGA